MSFETKVIYATDSHFTNPTTVAESGTPSSVTLQQLTPNQQYYTKAQIWNDGSMDDESSTEYFTTIPAGTITLTYIQTVRSGYGYDVSYFYTSTYAPSYATLSTNGSTFQGFIDSAQNVVSFWVTGLTSGEAYLTSVTLGDIYGETETVTGSIVTTVVNEVHITGTEPSETSIDVDISYVLDGGFWQGYVDYWLASQDYETEPSQGHTYFNDGADTVTMSGLSPDTAYKFRVTITLSDMTTEIESNMVTASTLIDYSLKYFTIKNESNNNNIIHMKTSDSGYTKTIYVSTDNGVTWTSKTTSKSGKSLGTLGVGESMLLKHTGALGNSEGYNTIIADYEYSVSGNIASLCFGDNFNTNTPLTMPDYAYTALFRGRTDNLSVLNTTLVSAKNLCFSSYSVVSQYGCASLFDKCGALREVPNLSTITRVDNNGMTSMFSSCESITLPPDITNITASNKYSLGMMFAYCTNLREGADIRRITSVGTTSIKRMYLRCSSLNKAYAPTITWDTSVSEEWLNSVANTGTLYADSSIASGIPTNNISGCPSGWTVVNV